MSARVKRLSGRSPVRFGAALLASAALFLCAAFASGAKPPAKQEPKKPAASPKPSTTTKKRTTTRRRSRVRGQSAPTAQRVLEIQEALIRAGHLKGKPSKKWDAAAVNALKEFQAANDLNPTGKLDARTLQKLGLGSEVAGLAPPRPVTTSSEEPQRR